MKLNEIMIIKDDGLKLFQVDDNTLGKLTRVRGNLFKDDPRLTVVKDLPTPEPKISPEMQARAEASWAAHCMERQATPIQTVKPLGFEEQIKNDWRTRPDIRAEFVSQASYEAYMRAQKAGKVRVYGCKS